MNKFRKQLMLCFTVLLGCMLCGSAASAKKVSFDTAHFPDAQVRKAVRNVSGAVKMYNGKKVVETDEVEYLYIRKAKNLKGIGCFTRLKDLTLSDYKGRTVSLKNAKLEYLYIWGSKTLGTVSAGRLKNLKYFSTGETYALRKITGLDKLTKLKTLDISGGKLDSLPISKCKNLSYFGLRENKGRLSSLNFSKNKKLTGVNIAMSNISSLDVSKNNKLTSLTCYGTKLSGLNIPKNVTYLASYNNIPYYQLPAKNMTLMFEAPVGGQIFLANYIGTGYGVKEASEGIYYDAASGVVTVGNAEYSYRNITLVNGYRTYEIEVYVK
ncbi:MAG: hypothetical protein NC300_01680 [Bacteroidales bacterium]|nr:hypothetical protein [Clostridium sp.]MCM1202836.1 hypothetical protein [Bacteroidales bacterium]